MNVLDLIMVIVTLTGLGIFPWPFRHKTTRIEWDITSGGHRGRR